MNKISWKKILPHILAIVAFLVIAMIYCRPAMQGQVLQQSDVIHWKGMAQDAFNYKEKHGYFPLWSKSLFSGMPNYQVAMESKSFLPDLPKIISLGLPKPASFFFIACVAFYALSMVLGFDVLIGVLASLAFAYATYDPIIVSVGHETKMQAIAYAPGLLAGILLIYKKKYWLGLGVGALYATLEITSNHPQITYYLLLVMGIMTIFYIVKWVKERQIKHMIVALLLAAVCGLVGVGNFARGLMTTYEYAQYTMRGGKTVEAGKGVGGTAAQTKTTGLDEDYAFQYSLGKSEALVLMLPNAFGGSSMETLDENSHTAEALSSLGASPQIAQQLPRYWGGIAPYTTGPPYSGTLICLLAVVALVVLPKDSDKWWLVVAMAFGLVLSFGQYLPGINGLLFKYMPMYNKFRAPSMAMVIPQWILPILAGLCLEQLFYKGKKDWDVKTDFKPILYALGGVLGVCVLVYLFNDYTSPMDEQLKAALGGDRANPILNAMHQDRKAMFGAGIGRVVLFSLILLAGIFLYVKKIARPTVVISIFMVITLIDLFSIDAKYLNTESYQDPESLQASTFSPTSAEQQIMADKGSHYRVLNLAVDPFTDALTSYYLRSVGGYHPAKLRIYQDILENQFSKKGGGLNMSVLNMLDTKYIIVGGQQNPQNPQQQPQQSVQQNPEALGAAWFVKDIQYTNGPAEGLNALGTFDPKTTAIVDKSNQSKVGNIQYDSTATIALTSYDNDTIQYVTNAATPQFAVLSEIYYPAGWNAYLDGKKADYVNANYALRGIAVPAGKHTVEFKFEPQSAIVGQKLMYASNGLTLLCFAFGIFGVVQWRKQQKQA
ncbi:MAG: YfhO family protein [Chitinophagaceae bacterium]